MSENTNKSPNQTLNLEVTKALPQDEVESARILFREGLIDEAKKTLFRILSHQPDFISAKKLLTQIEQVEMKELFLERASAARSRPPRFENTDRILESLNRDLGLELDLPHRSDEEQWSATAVENAKFSPREYLDLGIAFFEMECFADALRELLRAEKRIRIEQTFLDKTGIMVAALIAQCLVNLGKAFEAKTHLEPVLTEPDLKHEDKLNLYYAMGIVEQALESAPSAVGWFKKVLQIDPDFKDAQNRIRLLMNPK